MKTLKVGEIYQTEAPIFAAIEFCGISAGREEFIVDGLRANIGIGIVLPIRSALLATGLPVLLCTWIPPVAL